MTAPSTTRLTTSRSLAIGLFLLAALFSAMFTLSLVAPDSQNLIVILLRAPGRFFVKSFHVAAFYVSALLCVAAGLLLGRRLRPLHLLLLGDRCSPSSRWPFPSAL